MFEGVYTALVTPFRAGAVDEAALRAEMRELMAAGRAQQQSAAREAARLEPYYREMVFRAASQDVGMNRWLN